MKDTWQILSQLRKLMQEPPSNSQGSKKVALCAYIVPSSDAHQSEYICDYDKRRGFITGFHGSAGTAVVTMDKALLWTDGRYYEQATKDIDRNWTLMKAGLASTPSIGNWLARNLPAGSNIGVDPKLVSHDLWITIQKELDANECHLVPIEVNLVDMIWCEDRPQRTSNKILPLDLQFTGMSVAEKWNAVKKEMAERKADVVVVSALDEIAWFLNLRGTDIEYNPVFFAYLLIATDALMLFVDPNKLPDNFDEHQKQNNVNIMLLAYEQISCCVHGFGSEAKGKVWIPSTASYFLTALVPCKKLHLEITPIALMKAIKNRMEVEGFINCHIQDGIALCQYFAWLENALYYKTENVDEISGAAKLKEFRSKRANYLGESFATISASGPNGSIIHYNPTEATNRPLTNKELYLCDSGGQYLNGTTDVTRTIHFGSPSDFEKETYTRVLKGQLTLGSTIFPKKVQGHVLDTLARKALWDIGLDYAHGTGHGVGHYLNVHEGPMGISSRVRPEDPGLQENMFLSNEPGFYQVGEFGIRIEDIVQIVPAEVKNNFNELGALTFKTITMCPKQTKLIIKKMLTDSEVKALNDYHKEVWQTLSPILENESDKLTLSWLKRETKAI